MDQYTHREAMVIQDLTPERYTSWILTNGKDVVENGNHPESEYPNKRILSGCQSMRRTMFVGHNGKVREVGADMLTSVFTPSECRGKGYAARMLSELTDRMVNGKAGRYPLGITHPDISILYSDIGPKYYAKMGWPAHEAKHIKISVPSLSSPQAATNGVSISDKSHYRNGNGALDIDIDLPRVRILTEDEIPELVAADCVATRRNLESASQADPGAYLVTHVPSMDLLRYFWIREHCASSELYKERGHFDRGAIVTGPGYSEPGQRVWCYWSRTWAGRDSATNPKGNVMYILRIVTEAQPSFLHDQITKDTMPEFAKYARAIAALVRATQQEAQGCNLESIHLWNPHQLAQEGVRMVDSQAVVENRTDSSIPSLKWLPDLRNGKTKDVNNQAHSRVVWVQNDKLGWC